MRLASSLAVAVAALALAGCAVLLAPPVASMQNIAAARAAGLPPMALGSFALAAGRDPSLDRSVTMRTTALHSPYGNSFAAYLKETLAADLRAGGLLDPNSPILIEAQLTENGLSVPVGVAHATVAARFSVTRGGSPVFAKELRASEQWAAEFNRLRGPAARVEHVWADVPQACADAARRPGVPGRREALAPPTRAPWRSQGSARRRRT